MNDIKYIRKNRDVFILEMEKRGLKNTKEDVEKLIDLDQKWRENIVILEEIQQEKKKTQEQYFKNDKDHHRFLEKKIQFNNKISALDKIISETKVQIDDLLADFPNILDESVPYGKDENENKIIKEVGKIKNFDFKPLDHLELTKKLNLIDLESARKISGSRFSILRGDLAKMHRVLINILLEHNISYGYEEIVHPILLNNSALFNTGQLPKFIEDLFVTTDDRILSPTSEVALSNIESNKTIDIKKLPIRYTAYSESFRSEAGSLGKDTKGIIRQHQFSKVELVSITSSDQSNDELERMISIPENILEKLEIPYRRVLLCSGDTGFSSIKTYDIEVWIPSQNKYREISSCSNCGAFQARRLKTKYKDKNKTTEFVHTLNGSSLPIGRLIVAILENYQSKDGSIKIPDILKKYMNEQNYLE